MDLQRACSLTFTYSANLSISSLSDIKFDVSCSLVVSQPICALSGLYGICNHGLFLSCCPPPRNWLFSLRPWPRGSKEAILSIALSVMISSIILSVICLSLLFVWVKLRRAFRFWRASFASICFLGILAFFEFFIAAEGRLTNFWIQLFQQRIYSLLIVERCVKCQTSDDDDFVWSQGSQHTNKPGNSSYWFSSLLAVCLCDLCGSRKVRNKKNIQTDK